MSELNVNVVNTSIGTTIASSATINPWTVGGEYFQVSGTTTITGFAAAPKAGVTRTMVATGAFKLQCNTTSFIVEGLDNGVVYTVGVGELIDIIAVTTSVFRLKPSRLVSTLAVGNLGMQAYACRAWVSFNGTGTVAIRASKNVSSITDSGSGLYRINFTAPMEHSSYAVATSSRQDGDANENAYGLRVSRLADITTTGVTVAHGYFDFTASVNRYTDCQYAYAVIFA